MGSEMCIRDSLWTVAQTDYALNVLLAFLDGARRGLRFVKREDARAYPDWDGAPLLRDQRTRMPGRLTMIPAGVRNEIDRMGFFDIVAETEHPPLAAWAAYEMSRIVDWSRSPGYFY